MTTFTSSLPDSLLEMLSKRANQLNIPKNKLIERALTIYLIQLNKAEYVKSYKQMSEDEDMLQIAEEGITDYFTQLNDTEK
jgi:hypothetical protein